MEPDKKVAIISGGAGGIGSATALELAEANYYPLLLDRDEEACSQASKTVQTGGFENKFYCVELSNEQQIKKVFADILAEHKRVDALVNLAGGTFYKKRIQDLALSEWQEILDANLKSTFLCCRAVTEAMKRREAGIIVNTSSNFGFSGNPLHTAYSAAKYAIVGFSKSLALELAPYGVRVNCIAPGLTATDRVRSHHTPEAFEAMSRSLPMGHAAEPSDIAAGIAFLLSNDSGYITGQTLHVNGGMVMP